MTFRFCLSVDGPEWDKSTQSMEKKRQNEMYGHFKFKNEICWMFYLNFVAKGIFIVLGNFLSSNNLNVH